MKVTKLATATISAAVGYAIAGALTSKKDTWALSHGRDGWAISLDEAPTWAVLAEDVLDELPCFHPNSDWWWNVGLGPRDPDLGPKYSIGTVLFQLCQWRHTITFKVGRDVMRIPITDEQAQELDPEFYQDMEEIMNPDQMKVTFSDDNVVRRTMEEALDIDPVTDEFKYGI